MELEATPIAIPARTATPITVQAVVLKACAWCTPAGLPAASGLTLSAAKALEATKLVAKVMEEAPLPAVQLSVPLQVEARAAANWDEAH